MLAGAGGGRVGARVAGWAGARRVTCGVGAPPGRRWSCGQLTGAGPAVRRVSCEDRASERANAESVSGGPGPGESDETRGQTQRTVHVRPVPPHPRSRHVSRPVFQTVGGCAGAPDRRKTRPEAFSAVTWASPTATCRRARHRQRPHVT
jgi:hypothetical protein